MCKHKVKQKRKQEYALNAHSIHSSDASELGEHLVSRFVFDEDFKRVIGNVNDPAAQAWGRAVEAAIYSSDGRIKDTVCYNSLCDNYFWLFTVVHAPFFSSSCCQS